MGWSSGLSEAGLILVTGASGFVGGAIVSRLAVSGYDVVAMVRTAEAGSRFAGAGIPFRKADYDDREALRDAFAGVDELVLLSSDGYATDVARHHANAIAVAAAARVERVVFTSIVDVDRSSPFYFAPVYRDAEQRLAVSGLRTAVARCSLYSDFVLRNWLAPARNAGHFCFPGGGGKVAPISRSDVAAAIAAIVDDTPACGVFEISGGEALTLDEIADIYSRASQCPVSYAACSAADYLEWASARLEDPWPHAFATLGVAIEQGRFSHVSPDFLRLVGRGTEPLEAFLSRMEEQHPRDGVNR